METGQEYLYYSYYSQHSARYHTQGKLNKDN